jgi:hypothetical protein
LRDPVADGALAARGGGGGGGGSLVAFFVFECLCFSASVVTTVEALGVVCFRGETAVMDAAAAAPPLDRLLVAGGVVRAAVRSSEGCRSFFTAGVTLMRILTLARVSSLVALDR